MTDELPCREFVELVTEYLEEVMPPELRAAFEEHLQVCSGCRLYVGQMRITIRALHEPERPRLDPRSRQKLQSIFTQWRAQQAI